MFLTLWTPNGVLTCDKVSSYLKLFQAMMNAASPADQSAIWERNAGLLDVFESAYAEQANERALAFVRAVKGLKPEGEASK